ncbi:transcriptional regulator, LysR family protein [Roseobacter sp. SK209-2-6]|uniref:LysR family transcriptional regulator n=1 Tax=Roseobacter sp. SK209-2-6 TaxID=388739 RepID=UPI0000F3C1A3|nr:LysR family transcriptional regulator [Roseobacter sp. SK209-2-6]EBA15336.1 transcriptional regulator, LysR family protein [Roseobacter sp. SK209-2-6]
MEFNWLKDFIALASSRNFSRAAEERFVSQPAFSRRIRALENAVGVQLINRETLPLSLTTAGEIFLEQSHVMLRTLDETIERCQALDAEDENIVRLAASQSIYTTYYKAEILPLVEAYGLSLDLNSVSWPAEKFSIMLQQGQSDVIISYWHPSMGFLSPLSVSPYTSLTLARDIMVPVAKANPDGSPQFRLGENDKARVPLLAYGSVSVFRPVVESILSGRIGSANILQVSQNALSSTVKAMILEGFGLGWLPQRMCEEELESGELVLAGGKQYYSEIEIRAYRDHNNKKPRLEKFWQELDGN